MPWNGSKHALFVSFFSCIRNEEHGNCQDCLNRVVLDCVNSEPTVDQLECKSQGTSNRKGLEGTKTGVSEATHCRGNNRDERVELEQISGNEISELRSIQYK